MNDIIKFQPGKNTLSFEFFNLIMKIYSKEKNIFSPYKLVDMFLKKCNLFSLGNQSDSQRFYRHLSTILEKEFGHFNTCIKETFEGKFTYINTLFCENTFCSGKIEKKSV